MVKTSDSANTKRARIFYARVDEFARKEDKYKFLDDAGSVSGVEWQELQPDAKHTWLTEGMCDEFEVFLPIGSRETKATSQTDVESVFRIYTTGVLTGRDKIVYDFNESSLQERIRKFCDEYNSEVSRYLQKGKPKDVDGFLKYDSIKWSRNLKRHLKSGRHIVFDAAKTRQTVYRAFVKQFLYVSEAVVDELGKTKRIFPVSSVERENPVICITGIGARAPFSALAVSVIPNYSVCATTDAFQCFPLYTYNEDGTNRRENITDWALSQFRTKYADASITKLDIFHYVYALLHHPTYHTTYAANLKRELPRLPFVLTPEDFRRFVEVGVRLADLHVNYEAQAAYKLEHVENPEAALDWRVERMRLSKDKTSIVYNDFLTIEGIPPEAHEYRLGNRSALEWIVDQYQVSTDKRSGITNDPNRHDEPDYIVKLIGKVTTVSVETVRIVRDLPTLQL